MMDCKVLRDKYERKQNNFKYLSSLNVILPSSRTSLLKIPYFGLDVETGNKIIIEKGEVVSVVEGKFILYCRRRR